ncbi:P-loop containing nucleoside triphosphate hydrolase protein [Globomyces pollinis-pini]|nr:P-loop containing nucleoside triphosphate hydrolase protein [Globomyces pollinis-pini]
MPADYTPIGPVQSWASSGFWSRWTFSYFSGFVTRALNRDLVPEDYPIIDPQDDCESVSDSLIKEWLMESTKTHPSLTKVLFRLYGKSYILVGIPYLLEVFAQVGQGYFLSLLLTWFEQSNEDADIQQAAFYIFAISASLMGQSVFHAVAWFVAQRIGIQVRVGLIATIYRKSLKLSIANTASTGQIVNLLSNDVQRFEDCACFTHYIWAAPAQVLLVAYFMYLQIGWSCLSPIISLIVLLPLQTWFSKLFGKLRRLTVNFRDERIKYVSDMLAGIMVVKLYAWEQPFMKAIDKFRNSEMEFIWKSGILKALNDAISFSSNGLILLATFGSYKYFDGTLSPSVIFSIIAYFQIIRIQVSVFFPRSLQFLSETMVSIERIEEFMKFPEVGDDYDENAGYLLRKELNTDDIVIAMKDASFSWNARSEDLISIENNVLSKINLIVKEKELVAICGPVGSGKTSLLHAILGDVNKTGGQLYVGSKKIAFVSQSPWILSGTIKSNILFGAPFDKERFEQVIEVCALTRDLTLFPNGVDTILGERGVTLSGGQRARLALARAAYYDADTYMMDDPLSAVDTKVCRHLFEKCILEFLASKTVLLVTHQLQCLRDCSKIVIIENGTISTSGTFEQAVESETAFANTLKAFSLSNDLAKNKQLEIEDDSSHSAIAEFSSSSDLRDFSKEDVAKGHVELSDYIRYLKSGSNIYIAISIILLLLLGQVLTIVNDIWLSIWSSKDANEQNDSMYLIVLAIIVASTVFIAVIRALLFFWICIKSSKKAFKDMLESVFRSPMSFFQTVPHGRLMNRFSKDINLVDEMLPFTLFDFLVLVFRVLSCVLVSLSVVPYLLLLIPLIWYLFNLLRVRYIVTSRQIKRYESITRSPVYSYIPSTLEGLSIIRSFNAQDRFKHTFMDFQNENTKAYFAYVSSSRWLSFRLDLMSVMFVICMSSVCILLRGPFGVSAGSLGLVLSYSMNLTGLLQWCVRQSAEVENLMISTERVYEYTNLPSEAPTHTDVKTPSNWPNNGELIIKNLNLTYPNLESPQESGNRVLKDINIHISPGTKVGIVGRTGAGKSSFLQALFRLVEPDEPQSIMIDDIYSSDLGLTDLRSKISIIPQEPFCFKGTLRFNLDPFGDHSDDKLWKVLEAVQLKRTIELLPLKLDCVVAEGGMNWSVGERQLICLARAILKNTKLIVMDEATSSIDLHTDKIIQEIIRAKDGLFANATVLTIAHRLNTVIDYDKIMVLDAGKIVEFGNPKDLLSKQSTSDDAWFSRMVREMGVEAELSLKRQLNI